MSYVYAHIEPTVLVFLKMNTDFIALITILRYTNPRQKTRKDWYRIFSGNKCKISITKFMVLWKISLLEQNS